MSELKNPIIDRRIALMLAIMAAFFVAILAKLWWLQVIHHSQYERKAHDNRTRLIRDRAQRGRITDRNGISLATAHPSFSVYITPEDCPREQRKIVLQTLANLLDISYEELVAKYQSYRTRSFERRKLHGNVPFDTVTRIETHRFELPGVSVAADNIRFYPFGDSLCHLLGYVGEISQRMLESDSYTGYETGDIVGKTGVEIEYEKYLNGNDGHRWVEIDSMGRIGRTLVDPPPVLSRAGSDIRLTLDLDLQREAEACLGTWRGAIIAMDPRDGSVLAMASSPRFDPNWFASGISHKNWKILNSDPTHPLLNRCIQVRSSPGSVFKIITAISAMRSHGLNMETQYVCNGAIRLFDNTFHCWKAGGHGTVNVVQALEGSCNVFFYQEGLKAGIDTISQVAREFGLNAPTGIQLRNERSGFIPDREWKRRERDDLWWPGETISVSIGQGGVTLTPIQVVRMMAAVANRGNLYVPRIVQNVYPDYGGDTQFTQPRLDGRITLSDSHWDMLHQGLQSVVDGRNGTARALKIREFSVAGKTGTAQVISRSASKKLGLTGEEIPEKYRDHNWFAGFAPVDNPRIALVVYIENGGTEGARIKIELARRMFLKWFEIFSPGREGPLPPAASTDGDTHADTQAH